MSEQVPLLRRLLSEPVVTHDGEFDRITGAGLAPLPHQRPIPIWIGGQSPPAYRRIGRLADGWFPQVPPGTEARRGPCDHRRGGDSPPGGTRPRWAWRAGCGWTDDGIAKLVDHVGPLARRRRDPRLRSTR